MHVLYLIDSLVPGGAERSLDIIAPLYVQSGMRFEIAYFYSRSGDLHDRLATKVAALHDLSGAGGRAGLLLRSRRLIATQRPDLVHTTLFEADVLGRMAAGLARVPVVSSLVNIAYGNQQLQNRSLKRWKIAGARQLDALTGRTVILWHAVTRSVASEMGERLRIPDDRIRVIPRARDPKELGERNSQRASKIRSELGVIPKTPLVLAAARQEHQKGLDVLLKAWPKVVEQVPDAQLFVAGRSGNQTPLLQSMAGRLRLKKPIDFLGARDDVADLMCAADVFVMPSRWEGLGGVLLEAMALRVPIVTSDLPAVRELVNEEHAILVPPDAPAALTRGIVRSLADRRSGAERAERARRRFIEEFMVEAVAPRMISFYEEAVEKAGRRKTTSR